MDTMARVRELSKERNLSLYKLSKLSGVPYSTLKNTDARKGQLTVDSIEQLCIGLQITMSAFFEEKDK